jgi:thiamine pyrophosphate-dependent acetolactate synthase large subunit-like protein
MLSNASALLLSAVAKNLEGLTRYNVLQRLASLLQGKIVICNTGFSSRELYSILDQPTNFYMLGSMGLASSIGLGVALFTNKDVIVLDGDGSLLMNPNALFTIGREAPDNLIVVCIDNKVYGSTGNQPTLADKINLEKLAALCGVKNFIHILAKPGNAAVGVIPLSPELIKRRFKNALSSSPF